MYIYMAIVGHAQEGNYRLKLMHMRWYKHACTHSIPQGTSQDEIETTCANVESAGEASGVVQSAPCKDETTKCKL